MKMMKRVLAFALMLCILGSFLVIPDVAQAADYKGKTQRFLIRLSKNDYYPESKWYASTGVWVKMTSTSKDGKTGTIVFEDTLRVNDIFGRYGYEIQKGIEYNYKISSLINNGKITLTKAKGIQALDPNLYTITGKIHIDKSKGCKIANIWKIDTLKYGGKGMKIYFRNN